jgi:hypothetical protein
MPTKSSFPDVDIPKVDLWDFMFERKDREFSEDQGMLSFFPLQSLLCLHCFAVIYRSCNSDRHYTFAQVKEAASKFGQGLQQAWNWQKGQHPHVRGFSALADDITR